MERELQTVGAAGNGGAPCALFLASFIQLVLLRCECMSFVLSYCWEHLSEWLCHKSAVSCWRTFELFELIPKALLWTFGNTLSVCLGKYLGVQLLC